MEILFNGIDIHNADYVVSKRNQRDTGEKNINILSYPYRDGFEIGNVSFGKKTITISGTINKTVRIDIENYIQKLKKLVGLKNFSELQVQENGETRIYKAILQKTSFDRSQMDETCGFSMDFLSQPLSRSVLPSEYSGGGIGTSIKEVDYQGDVSAKIYLELNITGATNLVKAYNPQTNQQIEVYGAFVQGDVVEIDGENMSVKKNGAEYDYLGYFPEVTGGLQNLEIYSDSSYTYNLRFYNLYL